KSAQIFREGFERCGVQKLDHRHRRLLRPRRSHEEGWTGALDKLERHFLVIELRDQTSAAEPSVATAKWSAGAKPSTSFSRRHENRKGVHRMITISAFKWVPEFAQGQVRDLRARWALRKLVCLTRRASSNWAIRTNRTIARCSPSGRCRSLRKTASCSSN